MQPDSSPGTTFNHLSNWTWNPTDHLARQRRWILAYTSFNTLAWGWGRKFVSGNNNIKVKIVWNGQVGNFNKDNSKSGWNKISNNIASKYSLIKPTDAILNLSSFLHKMGDNPVNFQYIKTLLGRYTAKCSLNEVLELSNYHGKYSSYTKMV